jgi:hypothetical protein
MRFDEINIIGEFKINGLTGSPGQALGLSGSDFTWITVSASSVIDAVGLTGTDYVICQSVNTGNPGTDAIENGNRLRSAYATASALYVSNRVSVLITPGDYDFDATPLQLTTNKVDLIGISSDASDVILRASDANSILGYESGVDSALYNLTLGTSLDIGVSGNGTSYLRWKNVIVSQNSFYNSVYGFENLNGEFEDIKCNNNSNFAKVNGDLNGIFNNIKIGNNTANVISSNFGGIFGTFSNIEIGNVDNAFSSNSYITGYFKNITTGNVNSIMSSAGQITGEFENITIGNVTNVIYGSTVSGTFNNITIGDASYAFYTESANLTGTYSNIEISSGATIFKTNTSGSIIGKFQDITIGSVSSEVFLSSDNISGNFENIEIGDCVGPVLYSANATDGIFDNIKSGNSDTIFYTNDGLSGTFSNIKFGNTTAFYSSSSISGYFENISGGNLGGLGGFQSTQEIKGYYKNITLGDSPTDSVFNSGKIDGTYDQIKVGDVSSSFFYCNGGTMSGTFSNIEVGNVVGNTFYSDQSLIGTYENIKIGTCSNAFVSTTSDINAYFDTIEIGDSSYSIFSAGGSLYGTYKNIKMGNVTSYTFNSTNGMDGIFENIELKDTASLFENTNGSKTGTFSNINAWTVGSAFTSADDSPGYYKDITLGTVGNFMGTFLSSVIIDNLKIKSYIPGIFPGKIINSFVDARGLSQPAITITDDTVIERCKFLSDSGYYSITSNSPISAVISFTITNYGITSSITNNLSPADPLNIDNSNIT